MDLELKGKVVLITGASRGIGKEAALSFAQEGAALVLCARGLADLEKVAAECQDLGVAVACVTADVSKREDTDSLVKAALDRFGRIDVLINNAGEAHRSLELIPDDEVWQEHFDQYLLSIVRMIRQVVPHMVKGGGGRIVNISSGNWREPGQGSAARSTMKAAVTVLSKSLSNQLAKQNVYFNVVSPGMIATERLYAPGSLGEGLAKKMGLPVEDALKKYAEETHALGRFATTKEVADVILFLASERASGVVGSDYVVDAGGHRSI